MSVDVGLIVKGVIAVLELRKSRTNSKVPLDRSELEAAVDHHLRFVESWSSSIPFPAFQGHRALTDAFVHLHLTMIPRKRRARPASADANKTDRSNAPVSTERLIELSSHTVLLGDPGAGKSTVVKQLCQHLLHTEPASDADRCFFPLVLRCRELGRSDSLFQWILGALGIKLTSSQAGRSTERLVSKLLDECRPFLFIDGLDEASSEARERVLRQFGSLVHCVTAARMMLTCRSGGFDHMIEGADVYEIAPLNQRLIREFTAKWLPEVPQRAEFLKQLKRSPYGDTAVRPLTLVHLCALFLAYGAIPDRPRTIYRRIVLLLLEDWDRANLVQRKSAYAQFGPDRKADFLAAFSYAATMNGFRGRFSTRDLKELYQGVCAEFELPPREARQVATEIESHSGLLVQCGHDEYEIAHLSLQEYLCADYLVRGHLNNLPYNLMRGLADEIAIATALASNASDFFCELVRASGRITDKEDRTFWIRFLRRVLLEKPDFAIDSRLGTASLCILDRFAAANILDETEHLWREWFSIPAVHASLKSAANLCSAQRVGRGYTEITVLPSATTLHEMESTQFRVPSRLLPPRVFRKRNEPEEANW